MKKIMIISTLGVMSILACKNVEEEPEINLGYESNIKVPDPEPLTAEDSLFIMAQQTEYETNAR